MTASALFRTEEPYGVIKPSFLTGDHNGWYLLNGRAVAGMSANVQARAAALGIGANLGNAASRTMVDAGGALWQLGGNNTRPINQANIPVFTMNGTTNTVTNNHNHGLVNGQGALRVGGQDRARAGSPSGHRALSKDISIDIGGAHTHQWTVQFGGGGQQLNIQSRSMSARYFIYLGV